MTGAAGCEHIRATKFDHHRGQAARRCVVAALPPSLPAAKLVFALCAAFRTAGGRGDAAGLQGMRR